MIKPTVIVKAKRGRWQKLSCSCWVFSNNPVILWMGITKSGRIRYWLLKTILRVLGGSSHFERIEIK